MAEVEQAAHDRIADLLGLQHDPWMRMHRLDGDQYRRLVDLVGANQVTAWIGDWQMEVRA